MSIYYQDDYVTLYHGDCLELTGWLQADVLVTDPPYGIGWSKGSYNRPGEGTKSRPHKGIKNDNNADVRDNAILLFGLEKPGIVFGSPRVAEPTTTKAYLVYQKPSDAGFYGSFGGYRRDWEAIYLTGKWPPAKASHSAVIKTQTKSVNDLIAARYPGDTGTGHPHTKPLDVMETLISRAPDGVIADPFAGSGSTLVAARNLGRKAIGVELEEKYCEIIANRLSQGAFDFA